MNIIGYVKNMFKSDEDKCKDLIGVILREEDKDPFSSWYIEYKIMEVKDNYVRYKSRNLYDRDWKSYHCTCALYLYMTEDCHIANDQRGKY